MKSDGTDLPESLDLSTTNFFIHSLFEILEVYINGKLVSSKNYYSFQAYLLAHLSYSPEFKSSQLKNGLYFQDTNTAIVGDANTGYAARKKYIAGSKSCELVSRIYDDIFLQDRWIIPNCNISFKLKRAPVEFSLLAPVETNQYLIKLEECIFYVKKEMVHPKIVEIHEKNLEKTKSLYPFTRNEIKTISIPLNAVNSVTENIFSSNRLPQRVVIGFVTTAGLSGRYSKNPFLFEDLGITNLTLSIDNVAIECRSLNLSFNSRYLLGYQSLLTGLNLENKAFGIDRNSWLDGNVLFSFALTGYDGDINFYERTGNLKLEITFGAGLTKPMMGIILAQSQGLLKIDKYRTPEIENQGVL